MLSGPCGTGAGAVGMPVESAAGDQAAHVRALLLCGLGGRELGGLRGLVPAGQEPDHDPGDNARHDHLADRADLKLEGAQPLEDDLLRLPALLAALRGRRLAVDLGQLPGLGAPALLGLGPAGRAGGRGLLPALLRLGGGGLVGLGLMPDPVGGGLLVVGGLAASVSLRGLVHWFRSSRRQRADPTAPARWPGSWHRPTLSELTAATGPLRARGRW